MLMSRKNLCSPKLSGLKAFKLKKLPQFYLIGIDWDFYGAN